MAAQPATETPAKKILIREEKIVRKIVLDVLVISTSHQRQIKEIIDEASRLELYRLASS